ncbi:xylulokinase [Marinobacterium sp. D7]|uniref:xylulokinase n=1 Tax=Marinobacterium ramblicola TaxID=2849041 RepID=UPI001C2D4735|nr:xylulokinase [Marinobacterium ramblicola]MBV1787638.1 xylulokinase [Marinobacterium ramblicola]
MYMGVDCGTQGTKVVLLDSRSGVICGEGYAPHELISDANGRREQHPAWWIEAFLKAYRSALGQFGGDSRAIRGIGISGQQHGMVLLDDQGAVIRPAKLWCDTETAAENAELITLLGGEKGCIERLGLVVATGYTLSKLLWVKRHEPEHFQRIATLLLPHDYLNYWLTGERVTEYGDASGTGYFDIRTRQWAPEVLDLIDESGRLAKALPRLIESDRPVGRVRADIAELLGLSKEVIVSSGGGDNMMGAIGTGNIQDGIVTLSLGTSGALYAYSSQAPLNPNPSVAPFCSSNNGWLPLVCTMNLTGVINQVRQLFGYDLARFNSAAAEAPIGSAGITMLPFLNGERVPALPLAKGSFLGLQMHNLTPGNLCRAAIEGTTFGLKYGLDLLRESGIESRQIRLIGGGANSVLWRQIVADIMDAEVICPVIGESAALGGAIQAAWCVEAMSGSSASLAELCERFVKLDERSLALPQPGAVAQYRGVYAEYRAQLARIHCS